MPNPYGNWSGTKHRPGHDTGGARPNSGRKSAFSVMMENERKSAKKKTDQIEKEAELAARNEEQKKALEDLQRQKMYERERAKKVFNMLGSEEELTEMNYCGEDDDDDDDEYRKDDDDSDYDYHDDDEEEEENITKRACYMPPKGTPMHTVMCNHEDKWSNNKIVSERALEFWSSACNEQDPVGSGAKDPAKWYLAETSIFTWMPFEQFNKLIYQKSIKCIHAECPSRSANYTGMRTGNVKSHGSKCWRPMFLMHKIVWVMCSRLQCNVCEKTFTTINSKFLSQLPTRIVDRFPFYVGSRGPGLHVSVVHQFLSLMTKGILYGTFVNSINEVMSIQYSKQSLSYYDTLYDLKTNGVSDFAPKVFSTFDTPGEYGGIKLSKMVLKQAIFSYFQSREKYFQLSFQNIYDEGNCADHTHKFSKLINIPNWAGSAFTASYTVLSNRGLVCLSRMVYTKSTEELEDLIVHYGKIRKKKNVGPLKSFITDNLNFDGPLWRRVFKDELTEGVVPIRNDNYTFTIKDDAFLYHDTFQTIDDASKSISAAYLEKDSVVYGLDTECCWGDNDVKLLQVSFPNLDNNTPQKVHIFNLHAANIRDGQNFPPALKRLLLHDKFIPTGRAVGTDLTRIRQCFDISIKSWIELRRVALVAEPSLKATGLKDLTEHFLGGTLNKDNQRADYSEVPLPIELMRYAALDVLVSRLVYEKISTLIGLGSPYQRSIYEGPSHLNAGETVEILIGSKIVASGTVLYVGLPGPTVTRKWGSTKVGQGKVIVKVVHVYVDGVHPPYSFRSSSVDSEGPSWNKDNITLEDLINEEVMVSVSNVTIPLGSKANESHESCDTLTHHFLDRAHNDIETQVDHQPTSILDYVVNIENEEDDNNDSESFLRSRIKEDLFHQLQANPVKRSNPLYATFSRMLIHATYIFDAEDYPPVEKKVAEKLNINKNQEDFKDKIMEHFYYNREWWREHCKTYNSKRDDHAMKLQKILDLLITDEQLNEYIYCDEVHEYLRNFIDKAKRGYFEDQVDVTRFSKIGYDANNLPIYSRHGSSTRNELVHQHMHTAVGPWQIGARTAHILLVMLNFRFNVSTMIKKCAAPKFGHYELYYIDRIQNRIQELFDYLVWPTHLNVSNLQGDPSFISVGIGPLTYKDDYVERADEPASHLRGDKHFIAKQMGLKYPLLHMGSAEECRIYKNHKANFTGNNNTSLRKLAMVMKEKADGINVFYKLPSMLKTYQTKIDRTTEQKIEESKLSVEVQSLLHELFTTHTTVSTTAEVAPTIESCTAGMTKDNTFSTSLFTPPLQALQQIEYTPTIQSDTQNNNRNVKRCAWFPDCNKSSDVCGGFKRNLCIDLRHRANDINFIESNNKKKAEAQRGIKRDHKREKQKQKNNKHQKING